MKPNPRRKSTPDERACRRALKRYNAQDLTQPHTPYWMLRLQERRKEGVK